MFVFFIASSLFFLFYSGLLMYFSKGFNRRNTSIDQQNRRTVSVLIPAHNEENQLPGLLKCLDDQTYPAEKTEFLFINDRSTDKTQDILNHYASSRKNVKILQISMTPENVSPKKHALQTAIETAKNEIILTTDADARPSPEWIAGMLSQFSDRVGMVTGYAPYRTDMPYHTIWHKLLALDYFAMGAAAAATASMGFPTTCNGANLAYKKSLFQKLGGFGDKKHLLSGDDDLFMHKAANEINSTIRYSFLPQTAVFCAPPGNFTQFVRQRIRFASKHHAYPLKIKAGLTGIYFFHVLLLAGWLAVFLQQQFILFVLILSLLKAGIDIYFLKKAETMPEKRNLLQYYPLIFFPYLFYVTLFPLFGRIFSPKW